MSEFDIDKLLKAIDKENTEAHNILNYSTAQLKKQKNNILQKLGLGRENLSSISERLKGYRYVEDLQDVNYGYYVRWIDLENENVILTNGGHICALEKVDEDVVIKCKNIYGRFFQFKFGKVLMFQKLSNQEKILLTAADLLKK